MTADDPSSVLSGLRRFREPREAPRPGEVCEMCGEPIGSEHGHVVNTDDRNLLCCCRSCYLLFTNTAAARGKYRSVPERFLTDPGFTLTDEIWDALQIPVSVAFFFHNSTLDKTVAFYPSPAGATESQLSLETWDSVLAGGPLAGQLEPDVEALLVRRHDGAYECYLCPIDACYELVGLVRLHWKGFGGGAEVWEHIDEFFDRVRECARPIGAGDA